MSMIIDNGNLGGTVFCPMKGDAPLLVDADGIEHGKILENAGVS